MSKAILVLDEMPGNCYECDLLETIDMDGIMPDRHFCGAPGIGEDVEDYEACRPSFCPLREMPEPASTDDRWYNAGWNNCLRAIERSGKDA